MSQLPVETALRYRRKRANKRLAVLNIEHFPIVRHWYIVHRKSKRLSTAAQAFKQFLLTEAEHLTAPTAWKQGRGKSS